MAVSRVEGDIYFAGTCQFAAMTPPTGSAAAIGDDEIQANAGIAATKLEHRHRGAYREASDVTATTRTAFLLGVIGANATIKSFKAGLHTLMTNGGGDDMQVTFDLQTQAGTTQLTGVVTMNKSTNYTAKTLHGGTLIASPALVAGNSLWLVVTVSGAVGTQGLGVFAQVEVDEDAA